MIRIFSLALMVALTTSAQAFEVGDTVIMMRRVSLQTGQQTGDVLGLGTQVKVVSVEANRVQVSNGTVGWVDARAVAEPQAALAQLTALLKSRPNDAETYFARGNLLRSLGEYDRALEDLNAAIRLAPQAAAFNGRARICYEMGNYDQALSDYDRAIALSPRSAMLYNNRSAAWEKKGQLKLALTDCDQALKLNPQFTFAQHNRERLLSLHNDAPVTLAQNEAK